MVITERLTLEEFLALPEEKPSLEYESGRVTQKVSPQGKHSRLQLEVPNLFNAFTVPRKLAMAFTELRATFAGYSRVPDVSIYLWERIPLDDSGEVANRSSSPLTLLWRSSLPARASMRWCGAVSGLWSTGFGPRCCWTQRINRLSSFDRITRQLGCMARTRLISRTSCRVSNWRFRTSSNRSRFGSETRNAHTSVTAPPGRHSRGRRLWP